MYRMIYISTPQAEIGPADVDDILDASRKNNTYNNITGLLIQDKSRFLQYLEGDQQKVEETFARISCDRRHIAVIPLKSGYIGRRQFPNWSMASKYVDSDNSLVEAVSALIQNCDKEVSEDLLNFAEARDRAA
ncbi:BLUF domain-containing protein [Parasphingorhabdus cellanae]|uniref:BLUF domain-containing protein n=1 Tax=Parasphingorhabdus cellanae TaxID=2806553 RepID=A0ABX7T464_9SPHN|nr:BLUF domain-containing protein [Parasphingorhabdus cellanae]QTD56374.1 BLUF domain-containing protein [Parasphingorhabdus cellanae]